MDPAHLRAVQDRGAGAESAEIFLETQRLVVWVSVLRSKTVSEHSVAPGLHGHLVVAMFNAALEQNFAPDNVVIVVLDKFVPHVLDREQIQRLVKERTVHNGRIGLTGVAAVPLVGQVDREFAEVSA